MRRRTPILRRWMPYWRPSVAKGENKKIKIVWNCVNRIVYFLFNQNIELKYGCASISSQPNIISLISIKQTLRVGDNSICHSIFRTRLSRSWNNICMDTAIYQARDKLNTRIFFCMCVYTRTHNTLLHFRDPSACSIQYENK